MHAVAKLTVVEAKLFVREPMSIIFGLLFPPLLLLGVGSFIPDIREPIEGAGGLRGVDVYAPVMLVFALTMGGIAALPGVLTSYRERGVLRRIHTTPARPSALLVAHVLVNLASAVLASILAVAVAALAFDIALPQRLGDFALAFVLAAAAVFSLGLLIAAVAPSASAGQMIGTLLWFPVMFLAGLWFPREAMPEVMRTVSDFSPVGAAAQAFQDAWFGTVPEVSSMTVMAVWALVAGAVAAKLFRWG